ncbi:MAG: oligosaccharide flippase family protein [Caulobacteraceae bacterium]
MRLFGNSKRQPSLGRTTVLGAAWAFGQNVGFRAINFLSQLFLARILAPTDFGQIALVLTMNAFLTPLTDFGIEDVLVSRIKALRYWIGPAFGLSITLALLGAGLMMAASPLLAVVYRAPNFVGLTIPLALNMALSGLSTIPVAKLRAELKFGALSSYNLIEFLVIQTATVVLAWGGLGAYAFVLPLPFTATIKALFFWKLAPIPMHNAFRFGTWRFLLGRSGLAFGGRLLTGVREQGDNVLLGLLATEATVGAYALGFRLAAQPVYLLIRSLSVALFPAMATLAADPVRQTSMAVRAARILAYVVTPFTFLEAVLAAPLVKMLFGPKWLPAAPFIEILSIGLAFEVLPCVSGALATARGRFHFQFRAALVSTSCFVVAIALGYWLHGPIGMAFAVSAYFAVMSIAYGLFAFHPMPGLYRTVLELWAAPFLLSAVGIGGGRLLADSLAPEGNILADVILTTVFGGTIYLGLLGAMHRRALRELAGKAMQMLHARKPLAVAGE